MAFVHGMRHGKFTRSNELYPYYRLSKWEEGSGVICLFDTSCPSGWTQVTAANGKLLQGGSYDPNAGGSDYHTHTLDNHTHSLSGNTDSTDPGDRLTGGADNLSSRHEPSNHSHTVSKTLDSAGQGTSGDSSVTNLECVNRIMFVLCKKI